MLASFLYNYVLYLFQWLPVDLIYLLTGNSCWLWDKYPIERLLLSWVLP